jgi:hypothetical protein
VADFDRVWGTRVTRTREIIDTKQLISKPEGIPESFLLLADEVIE